MIGVISTLRLWNAAGASWHLIDVPAAQSGEIRAHNLLNRGGFGSVRVEATIGEVSWRTSLFPQKSGGYVMPVKADIRRAAGIAAGDTVRVDLELL